MLVHSGLSVNAAAAGALTVSMFVTRERQEMMSTDGFFNDIRCLLEIAVLQLENSCG